MNVFVVIETKDFGIKSLNDPNIVILGVFDNIRDAERYINMYKTLGRDMKILTVPKNPN